MQSKGKRISKVNRGLLGSIYKQDSKRIRVNSKSGNKFKCIEWFNGSSREIELNINQLNSMEYICTL